ncbi:unnamed protein product [Lota lota]
MSSTPLISGPVELHKHVPLAPPAGLQQAGVLSTWSGLIRPVLRGTTEAGRQPSSAMVSIEAVRGPVRDRGPGPEGPRGLSLVPLSSSLCWSPSISSRSSLGTDLWDRGITI